MDEPMDTDVMNRKNYVVTLTGAGKGMIEDTLKSDVFEMSRNSEIRQKFLVECLIDGFGMFVMKASKQMVANEQTLVWIKKMNEYARELLNESGV